jgi:hypothetical protein
MSIHRSVLVLAALASLATAGTSASAWGHGRSGYFGGPRFAGVFVGAPKRTSAVRHVPLDGRVLLNPQPLPPSPPPPPILR